MTCKPPPTAPTIEQAARSGALTLTPRIDLIQLHAGVIMIAPVRGENSPRGDGIAGFTQIVFRLHNMLETLWNSAPASMLDFLLVDSTDPATPPVYLFSRFASGNPPRTDAADGFIDPLTATNRIAIGGRVWTAHYRPSEDWLAQQKSGLPLVTLFGGLLLTALSTAYVRTLARRNRHIATEVRLRTAQLRQTQTLLEEDIAQRQRAEAQLQETSRQLGSILGQIPGMVYRADWGENPRHRFVSTGCRDLTGYAPEDILNGGINYLDLVHAEDRDRLVAAVDEALRARRFYEIEYRLHDRHGDVRWVLDRGTGVFDADQRLLFIEGLAININDRREAEAEKLLLERKLLEGQKLESLGVLAGGIAHDFNNLLTGILGHANLLRQDVPDPGATSLIDRIERSALRAAELCQQMLAYSGRGRYAVQTVCLDQLTSDLLPLIEASIGKQVRINLDFAKPAAPVCVDPTQIRQIIMNLVINASDAIGKTAGDILIKTGRQAVDRRYLQSCVLSPDLPGGEYAFLEVGDTGCGMDAETLAKIFDPFFTTKFTGRGLGLAAVLGIIRGHQGALHVSSRAGFGSTFRMLLPCAGQPLEGMQSNAPFARTSARSATAPDVTGPARILLVDDDEQVRLVGEQILRSLGHHPTLAADGETAMQRYKNTPHDHDLILLDLTMPGMDGAEVMRRMHEINPGQPILIMSGYSEQDAAESYSAHPAVGFLQKPFTMAALRERIDTMLKALRH
ncbi:MAG: response regulator [Verrucomicrobiota bacterium]